MACKRSGVRIPVAPLPVQDNKFEQPPRGAVLCRADARPRPAAYSLQIRSSQAVRAFPKADHAEAHECLAAQWGSRIAELSLL
jgi:hypothetical protein